MISKEEAHKAAKELGSILGKRNSKAHLTRISRAYWSSPKGKAKRSNIKSK